MLIPQEGPRARSRRVGIESLEDRLLLAGDGAVTFTAGTNASITATQVTRLQDGISELIDWSGFLGSFDELSQPLELLRDALGSEVSLSELVDPGQVLSDLVSTGISNYLTGDASPTTGELVTALSSLNGVDQVAGGLYESGTEMRFDIGISENVSLTSMLIDLGAAGADLGIDLVDLEDFDLTLELAAEFTFGLDLEATLGAAEAFFVEHVCIDHTFAVTGEALDPQLRVGILEVSGAGATLYVQSTIRAQAVALEGTVGGRVTRADLQSGSAANLVSVTVPQDNLSFDVPISASLGGWTPSGSPSVTVAGGLLSTLAGGDGLSVSVNGAFDVFDAFRRIDPATILAGLTEVGNLFSAVSLSSDLAFDVPFIEDLGFGETASLGTAWVSAVVEDLTNGLGLPTFTSIQDLASQLNNLGAANSAPNAGFALPSFDDVQEMLTFDISLTETLPDLGDINLGTGSGILSNLESAVTAKIERVANFDLSLGIDLRNLSDVTPGDLLLINDAVVEAVIEPIATIGAGAVDLGFVAIEYGQTTLGGAASVAVGLQNIVGDNAVSVKNLVQSVASNLEDVASSIVTSGQTVLELGNVTVNDTIVNLNTATDVIVTIASDPTGFVENFVVAGDQGLRQFANMTAEHFVSGLLSFVEEGAINVLENGSAVADAILGTGTNVLDVINPTAIFSTYVDAFESVVDNFETTTGRTAKLGDMPELLGQALVVAGIGTAASTIGLVRDTANDIVKFEINLLVDVVGFAADIGLDLADWVSAAGSIPGLGALTDVGDWATSGDLISLDIDADIQLDFGLDLDSGDDFPVMVYDTTALSFDVGFDASGLDLLGAIGALGIDVSNGSITLGDGVDPAELVSGLPAGAPRPLNLMSALTPISDAFGSLSIDFPLTGVLGEVISNDLEIVIGDISDIAGSISFPSIPNIADIINGLDLTSNLTGLVDPLNDILADFGLSLDLGVLAQNFPLLGDGLQGIANALDDFRDVVFITLDEAREGATTFAINQVRNGLENALDAAFGNLATVTIPVAKPDEVIFNVTVDFNDTPVAVSLDGNNLGLPGLSLALDGELMVEVDFQLDLTFGINDTDGVFIDTSVENELILDVVAELAGAGLTGQLGFMQVSVMDSGTTRMEGRLEVDLLDPNDDDDRATFAEARTAITGGHLEQLVVAELTHTPLSGPGSPLSDIDLEITAELINPLNGQPIQWLPAVTTFLSVDWGFDGGDLGGARPSVQFVDAGFKLSDTLTNVFGPFFDSVAGALEPLLPIVDLLETEIPVISDFVPLEDQPFTLLDAVSLGGDLLGAGAAADFVSAVNQAFSLINTVNSLSNSISENAFISFGNLDFSNDLRDAGSLDGYDLANNVVSAAQSAAEQFDDLAPELNSEADALVNKGGGLSFPIIDNPLSVFELLLGIRDDVSLLTFGLPSLDLNIGIDVSWPIPPVPILSVGFYGRLGVTTNLGVGFDTKGLFDFAESGDPADIFNGFFISDTEFADGTGEDVPEATIRGEVGANFGVDLVVAEAKIEGGIEATLEIDLVDPDNDGKVRGNELFDGCFIDSFDFHGLIEVELTAYAKVIGVERWDYPLARATLLEFDTSIPCPAAVTDNSGNLATQVGNELILNVGSRANLRTVQPDETDESLVVRREGNEIVVEGFRRTDRFNTLGLGTIVANAGEGSDVIIIEPGTNLFVDLNGDAGVDILDASGSLGGTINGGNDDDVLTGSPNGDSINGGSGNDEIHGLGGADTIRGEGGDDTVFGGAGNDTIFGDDGDDYLDGGADNDTIQGNDGEDTIYGRDGDDDLRGFVNADTIDGGAGDDFIDGGSQSDILFGGPGEDEIEGGSQADVIYGGDDDDEIIGEGGADLIYGQGGNDTIAGLGGNDEIDGGDGNDTLNGGVNDDLIFGGDGVDTIHGDQNNDTVDGGAGNDFIWGDLGDDDLSGGSGNDTIYGGDGNDVIRGDSNQDLIYGGLGDDDIDGGTGLDVIYGEDGEDLLRGGAQNDTIDGGDDNDTIYGDAGADVIDGRLGDDFIDGGAGNDLIRGQDGADVVFGGAGIDTIKGGDGNDELHGQDGDDLIVGFRGADLIFGDGGNDVIYAGGSDDEVYGGSGDDRINGEEGDDKLFGGADQDSIRGGDGNDIIGGGSGDDQLYGQRGVDALAGDDGNDYLLAGLGVGNVLLGGAGDDEIIGADLGDEDPNLFDFTPFGDYIDGGDGDDRLFGLRGADVIFGGKGDDFIDGGSEGDYLSGGADNDEILGHSGDDLIDGNQGHDLLRGEAGSDTVNGGDGDDLIIAINGDTIDAGAGDDTVEGSDDAPDVIDGGPGDDTIFGFGGNDIIDGGDGDDNIDGGVGDDVIQGEAGSDHLVGGEDNDRLYGFRQVATGDDNTTDYLFGDLGDDDAGAFNTGEDTLNGNGGYDFLYGEGNTDTLIGSQLSDTIDYGGGLTGGEVASPATTPNPTLQTDANQPRATDSRLSQGSTTGARWSELAGSASEFGINLYGAEESSIYSVGNQVYVAWSDNRNGNYEIYVAHFNGSSWNEAFPGSASGGGFTNTEASSREPSIVVVNNSIYMTWIESTAAGAVVTFSGDGSGWLGVDSGTTGTLRNPELMLSYDPGLANVNNTGFWLAMSHLDTGSAVSDSVVVTFWDSNVDGLDASPNGLYSGSGATVFGTIHSYDIAVAGDHHEIVYSTGVVGNRIIGWRSTASPNAIAASGAFTGLPNSDNTNPQVLAGGSREFPDRAFFWQSETQDETQILGHRFGVQQSPLTITNEEIKPKFFGDSSALDVPSVSNTTGYAARPEVVGSAGAYELYWVDESVHQDLTSRASVMTMNSVGGLVVGEILPGDAEARGIYQGGHLELSVGLTGLTDVDLLIADDDRGRETANVLTSGRRVGTVRIASEDFLPQDMIDQFTFNSNSLVQDVLLVEEAEYGSLVVKSGDHPFIRAYDQMNPPVFEDVVAIQSDDTVLRYLHTTGGVVLAATDVLLEYSTVEGEGIMISGGDEVTVRENRIDVDGVGITWEDPHQGSIILGNDITSTQYGININTLVLGRILDNRIQGDTNGIRASGFAPLTVRRNEIYGSNIGVDFRLAVDLAENDIHSNVTGIRAQAGTTVTGIGFFNAGLPNRIHDNETGILMAGGRVQDQEIYDNQIGVAGTGLFGGSNVAFANEVADNGTGIALVSGDIQYNVVRGNDIGILVRDSVNVHHNQIFDSTTVDLLVQNTSVQYFIHSNTIYTAAPVAVELQQAVNGTLNNNIIVNRGGQVIVMDDDSAGNLKEIAYNTYHTTGPVAVTLDGSAFPYTDALDQLNDFRSQGTTPNELNWSKPAFRGAGFGDVTILPNIGGQRRTSPTVGAGDPALAVGGVPNVGAFAGTDLDTVVTEPMIRLVNPMAITSVTGNQGFLIEWDSQGIAFNESVRIRIFNDNGTSMSLSTGNQRLTNNSGSYTFVPSSSVSNPVVEISLNFDRAVLDHSFRDTAPPIPTLDTTTSQSTRPSLSGSLSEPGTNVTVTIDGQTHVAVVNGTSWTVSGLDFVPFAEGRYDVTIETEDAAGNAGTFVLERVLLIDQTPAIVIVNDLETTNPRPNITGTTNEIDATIEVSINGDPYAPIIEDDGTWTVLGNALNQDLFEGLNFIDLFVTDAADNFTFSSGTVLLDTEGPSVSVNTLVTNDVTPTLTGTTSSDTTDITVSVAGSTYPVPVIDGQWQLLGSRLNGPLANGVYSVGINARDGLGNVTNQNFSSRLTVDGIAPQVTVNPAMTNDATPLLSGMVNDPSAAIQVRVNGNVYAGTNLGNGNWFLANNSISPPLTQGVYDLQVQATDAAGNAGQDQAIGGLRIDLQAPTTTIDFITTNDNTPNLTGTVDDPNADVAITIGGQTIDAQVNGNGVWGVLGSQFSVALADGLRSAEIVATDTAGNKSTTVLPAALIDTQAPNVTINALTTSNPKPDLSGSVDVSAVAVRVRIQGQWYPAVNISGNWTFDGSQLVQPLAVGTYSVRVEARDAVGNVGVDTTNNELTIEAFTGTPGDFDNDGDLDIVDLESLIGNLGGSTVPFDLDGDGSVDSDDVDVWIEDLFGTVRGDANLDGRVDLLDLDLLGQNWQQSGTWSQADFTLDGQVNLLDLDVLGQNWGFAAVFGNAPAFGGLAATPASINPVVSASATAAAAPLPLPTQVVMPVAAGDRAASSRAGGLSRSGALNGAGTRAVPVAGSSLGFTTADSEELEEDRILPGRAPSLRPLR